MAKSLYLFFVDHDKLYAPGALTDPGEYENLPFHGLQSAPNKVRTNKKLFQFSKTSILAGFFNIIKLNNNKQIITNATPYNFWSFILSL